MKEMQKGNAHRHFFVFSHSLNLFDTQESFSKDVFAFPPRSGQTSVEKRRRMPKAVIFHDSLSFLSLIILFKEHLHIL